MKEKLVELPLMIQAHRHVVVMYTFGCRLFSHASLAEYMLLSPPSWVGVPSYCLARVWLRDYCLSCVGHLFPIKLQLGAVSAHSNTTDAFSM